MIQTTKIHISEDNKDGLDMQVLYNLCYHSARLYNVGLYSVRQYYFANKQYLSFFSNCKECRSNENYKLLMSDASSSIIKLVDKAMKSFFGLLSLKSKGQYDKNVRLPRYKGKDDVSVMPINGRSCRIQKDGTVNIGLTKEFRELYNVSSKKITITIPKNLKGIPKFEEMRIIPLYGGREFDVEFIYDTKYLDIPQVPEDASGYLSIDLGVNNLMSCTVHSNSKPDAFIIDGRYVKNVNYYYNKRASELRSAYSKNKYVTTVNTKRFRRLSNGRNHRINDYFNRSVKYVVDYCMSNDIKTVVVGHNANQKQNAEMGKVNNQNFVSIPYHKLFAKLQGKCELHGITFASTEESYTSKASAVDLDCIPRYGDVHIPEFSGKRIKRGLYKTNGGCVINADINGSINILRKFIIASKQKDLPSDCVRAFVNTPVRKVRPSCKAHRSLAYG